MNLFRVQKYGKEMNDKEIKKERSQMTAPR
jgi:hypothetical protein